MAVERLKFIGETSFDGPRDPGGTHTIEYRRVREHYGRALDSDEAIYEIYVDGASEPAGYISKTSVQTSRSPITSRIRYGLGSHFEWSWDLYRHTPEGERWLNGRDRSTNYPGLYGETRRLAVSEMLGYARGWQPEVIK